MTNGSTRSAPLTSIRRRRSRKSLARGMTLIEISIALLIVGLLVFVAVPSIESLVGIKAREEAGRLSGAIRYLYGESILTGKVCRMVFDLDARQYWAECTEGRFTLDREKERARDGKRTEEREEKPRAARDDQEQMRQQIEKKAEFSSYTKEELQKRALPDGANLAVWVSHQQEKYTKGQAFLYFFPQGFTERARIWVTSDHGTAYTLVVSPLNGRVKVEPEELEVPKE